MKQTNNKSNKTKLIRVLFIIVILSLLDSFSDGQFNFLSNIVEIGLAISIVFAIVLFFKVLFNRNNHEKNIPKMSKEKEIHYAEFGMNNQEIAFFRETMAEAKKQIDTLEKNMQSTSKLKAINLRYDTTKACRAMFKEIVKEPNKLHQSDRFLYNHLPNIVELTSKYIEINNHELKNKDTYEALNQSVTAIEEVSTLIVKDYSDFVREDIEDLDLEISIAKQNISREKEIEEYKKNKELD